MIKYERDMSIHVIRWLDNYGFTCYAEFPNYNSPVDIVGVQYKPFYTIAVEMKVCLTKGVIKSAIMNQTRFNESWCVVSTNPRDLSKCIKFGLGVATVCEDKIIILLDPKWNEVSKYYTDRNYALANKLVPGGVGGVPCMKGIGPARDVLRRIDEYKKEHPCATWKELFKNIPNHYYSQNSMYGAMRMLKYRDYLNHKSFGC